MRTSATGRRRGFTLVEALVALAIVALGAALAVAKLSPQDARLESEARRVADLLQSAHDRALVTGRPVAWRADARGYAFLHRPRGAHAWREMHDDAAYATRRWPPGLEPAAPHIMLVFDPAGANPPFEVVLRLAGTRVALRSDVLGAVRVERHR